jgi:hypothetical protein
VAAQWQRNLPAIIRQFRELVIFLGRDDVRVDLGEIRTDERRDAPFPVIGYPFLTIVLSKIIDLEG